MYSLTELPLQHHTVFLRVDFNVPISQGKVQDNFKIKKSLASIEYLLQKHAKVVLASHLGRPEGKKVQSLSLKPVARELQKLLPNKKVVFLEDCIGKAVRKRIAKAQVNEVFLLENLRFYKEEEENDVAFAHSLANLADFYVNDAFAVSHRKQASVVAITNFLPSAAGFLLQTELLNLKKVMSTRKKGVWILGGAKLKKIDLIESALQHADKILLGGAIIFPFLKAKGLEIGHSLSDGESVSLAKRILKKHGKKRFVFPVDFVCADKFSSKAKPFLRDVGDIGINEIALDIGPKTVQLFSQYLNRSQKAVWNGPLGYTEWNAYQKGSKAIAQSLASHDGFSLCGGGETAEMIRRFKLDKKISHVSTGGGASLHFLSGKKLPGIEALEAADKRKRNKGILSRLQI